MRLRGCWDRSPRHASGPCSKQKTRDLSAPRSIVSIRFELLRIRGGRRLFLDFLAGNQPVQVNPVKVMGQSFEIVVAAAA